MTPILKTKKTNSDSVILPTIDTTKILNFKVCIEKETVLEEKLLLHLDHSKPAKFGSITEYDFIKWIFSKKKRKYLSSLDWVFPLTPFLSQCFSFIIPPAPNQQKVPIDATRLFINLIGFCFKHQYKICFIGTTSLEENHLRRNFKFIFNKLSDFSFLSYEQVTRQLTETVHFLKKSNYQFIVVSKRITYFKDILIKELPNTLIFFDNRAIGIYAHKENSFKRNKSKLIKMLQFPSYLIHSIKFLLQFFLIRIPYRLLFLIFIFIYKIFQKEPKLN